MIIDVSINILKAALIGFMNVIGVLIEPVRAIWNYYADALGAGNLAVTVFMIGISITAYWQIGSVIKWCICKIRNRNAA